MTVQQTIQVLLPVGRIVQGDLYKPQDKDQQGNPLTIKTGPNAGKPTVRYFFAIAIAKTPGVTHWASEPWGRQIWDKGHLDWASLVDKQAGYITYPGFAWKIDDGDDTTPNPKSKPPMQRNCDREGFAGHWIVSLSSTFEPKIFNSDGTQPLLDKGLVKRGFYVEVLSTCSGNGNSQNPGVYLNHSLVAYRAPGQEIQGGADAAAVGFGKAGLPVGVSAVPTGNAMGLPGNGLPPGVGAPLPGGLPAGTAGVPTAPAGFPAGVRAPGLPAGLPSAGVPAPAGVAVPVAGLPGNPLPGSALPAGISPSSPPTSVQPHPGFLQPAVGLPALPAVQAAPVLAPGLVAQGYTWAQLQAQGVTVEQARASGWLA